jgi:hypothetical protein
MRGIGQILSTEICNYADINNVSTKCEQSRLIVRGENFCKVYEKIKGIEYEVIDDRKIINVILDVNIINGSKLKKYIEILNGLSEYSDKKDNTMFWNRICEGKENVNNVLKIFKYEKKISYRSHFVIDNENVRLGNDYYYKRLNDKINIFSKASKILIDKKAIGGIIFDDCFSFLEDLNDSGIKGLKGSKNKNVVIADTLPKYKNETFDFLQINTLDVNSDLTNKRIFIYYPTEHMLTNLVNNIKYGLMSPKTVWIVFPKQINLIDFKKILHIIFWSDKELSCRGGLNLISINYDNLKEKIQSEKMISIERIKFDLSIFENNIVSCNDDLRLLDKFYFSNVLCNNPKTIYSTEICTICTKNINSSHLMLPAYFQCGHEFCAKCTFDSYKVNISCPLCRFSSNQMPLIQGLSLTKMGHLKKLLLKLINIKNENDNILIYTDNQICTKGLYTWLKLNFSNIPSSITNRRKVNFKNTIIVCQKESYYVCKNIKNISEIITISTNNDFIVNVESLGYNYFFVNSKIRIWMFDSIFDN